MAKLVTLKSDGNWKLPLRLDKKKAEVVDVTSRGNLKVKVEGTKHVRTVNPETDIYETIEV